MREAIFTLGLILCTGVASAGGPAPLIAVEPVGATSVRLTLRSGSKPPLQILRPRVGQLSTFARWAGWSLEVTDAAGARWQPVAIPGTPVAPTPADVLELRIHESWGVLISLAGFTRGGTPAGKTLAATPGRYRLSVRFAPSAETLAAVQRKGAPAVSAGPFGSAPQAIDVPANQAGPPPTAPRLRLIPMKGTTVRVRLDHHGLRPMHVLRPRSGQLSHYVSWIGWTVQVTGTGGAWRPITYPGPAPIFNPADVVWLRPGESVGLDVGVGGFRPGGNHQLPGLGATPGAYTVKVRYAPGPGEINLRMYDSMPPDMRPRRPPGPRITAVYRGPLESGTVTVRVPD